MKHRVRQPHRRKTAARSLDRRCLAEKGAGNDANDFSFAIDFRQQVGWVMREVRVRFLVLLRQRNPDLNAVEFPALFSELVIGTFGVHNAASGGHPVNRAGLNRLHAAETVPMNDRALE